VADSKTRYYAHESSGCYGRYRHCKRRAHESFASLIKILETEVSEAPSLKVVIQPDIFRVKDPGERPNRRDSGIVPKDRATVFMIVEAAPSAIAPIITIKRDFSNL
jgi:hypothetical protein